jgi:hypothetical protein
MLHEQLLNRQRRKLVLQDWPEEYGPDVPSYKILYESQTQALDQQTKLAQTK